MLPNAITRGPWKVRSIEYTNHIVSEDPAYLDQPLAIVPIIADARLMCAARDMYLALSDAVNGADGWAINAQEILDHIQGVPNEH